jgi:acyl carrier protein
VPLNETSLDQLRHLLGQVLGLGAQAAQMKADTALLGSLPELDSMAVATVLTAIEERFGISIDDSLISADIFETLGSLGSFIENHLHPQDTAA